MKHDDELKNKNEQSRKLEEIKEAQAGMLLTDDEVSEVAGGNEDGETRDYKKVVIKHPDYSNLSKPKGDDMEEMKVFEPSRQDSKGKMMPF